MLPSLDCPNWYKMGIRFLPGRLMYHMTNLPFACCSVPCWTALSVLSFCSSLFSPFPASTWWCARLVSFSSGFNMELTVLTRYGLDKSKLCGVLAKSFIRPFRISKRIKFSLVALVAEPLICGDVVSITVRIRLNKACSRECFSLLSCIFKDRPNEAFSSAMREFCTSGSCKQEPITASNVRESAGTLSLFSKFTIGNRWSNKKARIDPSYCRKKNFEFTLKSCYKMGVRV